MMKTLPCLAVLCSILTSLSAQAENGGRGGGNAIAIDGQTFAFDLFENGVEKSPFFGAAPADARVKARIVKRLNPAEYPVDLIAKKISELEAGNFSLAWALVETIDLYSWHLVDGPLAPVSDQQDTVVDLPATGELLQAAVRDGEQKITISRPIWNAMSATNRAALVLHELIYALVPPLLDEDSMAKGEVKFWQDSRVARRIVGFIFSPELKEKGWGWLMGTYDFQMRYSDSIFIRSWASNQFLQGNRGGAYYAIGTGDPSWVSSPQNQDFVKEFCGRYTPETAKNFFEKDFSVGFSKGAAATYLDRYVEGPYDLGWAVFSTESYNPGWKDRAECEYWLSNSVVAPNPFLPPGEN